MSHISPWIEPLRDKPMLVTASAEDFEYSDSTSARMSDCQRASLDPLLRGLRSELQSSGHFGAIGRSSWKRKKPLASWHNGLCGVVNRGDG